MSLIIEPVNDHIYRVRGVEASLAGVDAALEKLYSDHKFSPTIIAFCKDDYDRIFAEVLADRDPGDYPISPSIGAYGNPVTGIAMLVRLLLSLSPGTIQLWSGTLREAVNER